MDNHHHHLMEIITILGYIVAMLIAAIPIAYKYSTALARAMTYLYKLLNIISVYMKGNTDHTFTDAEKLALADQVIELGKEIDADPNVDAILNFIKSKI